MEQSLLQLTLNKMDKKIISTRPSSQLSNSKIHNRGNSSEQHVNGGANNKEVSRKQVCVGKRVQSKNGEVDSISRKNGWGRAANKVGRNKEKGCSTGEQVGSGSRWSNEDPDEELILAGNAAMPLLCGRRMLGSGREITERVDSWFERDHRSNSGYGGRNRGKKYGKSFSKKHSDLHSWMASAQFLVNRSKEVTSQASLKLPIGYSSPSSPPANPLKETPDDTVDWVSVEEVVLHRTELANCPICCYPPVAPKVTKCSHVYCFNCILHYLALTDKKGASCPICYEDVEIPHLKSVVTVVHPNYCSGGVITMVLKKADRLNGDHQMYAGERKISATREKVQEIIERELTALETKLVDERDEPESCFVEQAIGLVRERKDSLQEYSIDNLSEGHPSSPAHHCRVAHKRQMSGCSTSSNEGSVFSTSISSNSSITASLSDLKVCDESKKEEEPLTEGKKEGQPLTEGKKEGEPLTEGKKEGEPLTEGKKEGEPLTEGKKEGEPLEFSLETGCKSKSPKALYFYQAVDGSHVYLHPVNVSMLVAEYGEGANCPETITANILEKQCYILDEDLKNKYKYLQHLPLHCPFETVELSLSEPLISKKIISGYRESLSKREKVRKARAQEELKIERRNIALQEEEMSGRLFKRINSEARAIQSGCEVDSLSNDPKLLDEHFPQMGVKSCREESEGTADAPPSFANMVRAKNKTKVKERGCMWPSLGGTEEQQTGGGGAWGTPTGAPSWGANAKEEPSEEDFNAPDFRQTFSQGIDILFTSKGAPQKKKKGRKGKK